MNKHQTADEQKADRVERDAKASGIRWSWVGKNRIIDLRVRLAHLRSVQSRYKPAWQVLEQRAP